MNSEGDRGKSGSAGNAGTSEGETAPSPETAPQGPRDAAETSPRKAPAVGSTVVGTGMKFAPAKPSATNPPPIVPQRRTPAAGTARPPIPPGPATKPSLSSRPPAPPGPPRVDTGRPTTTTKTLSSVPPALKTLSSAPPLKAISSVPPPYADTVVAAGAIATDAKSPIIDVVPKITPAAGAPPFTTPPPAPVADIVPPMIRIPQGGLLGGSTPTRPPGSSSSMLCHVLVQKGYVTQAMVDRALAI